MTTPVSTPAAATPVLATESGQGPRAGNGLSLHGLPPECVPNLDDLVIQDDTPVDGILSEKNMRLLTEPLYSSWLGPGPGRGFLALANVGVFHTAGEPPLVPDVLLSLGVSQPADLSQKANLSYFVWLRGKVPDVGLEIVSNREGGEADTKLRDYARIGVPYYVIYDPENLLSGGVLRAFQLRGRKYELTDAHWLEEVGLGLLLWEGPFEGVNRSWLRWCDRDGRIIPTGAERAVQATQEVERLREQLRALGVESPP